MFQAETAFHVIAADWAHDEAAIAQVRRRVFIEEQAVPEAMEWESRDAQCDWFLARSHVGEVVGIVRLTPDKRIGRMAVLPAWRRRGVGSALLCRRPWPALGRRDCGGSLCMPKCGRYRSTPVSVFGRAGRNSTRRASRTAR